MTLLGQFALWAAFLVGLWCVVLSFSGKWQGRPELSRTIVRSVYAGESHAAAGTQEEGRA